MRGCPSRRTRCTVRRSADVERLLQVLALLRASGAAAPRSALVEKVADCATAGRDPGRRMSPPPAFARRNSR